MNNQKIILAVVLAVVVVAVVVLVGRSTGEAVNLGGSFGSSAVSVASCYNSDEAGSFQAESFTPGFVEYISMQGQTINYTDSCSLNSVREYRCNSTTSKVIRGMVLCANGCKTITGQTVTAGACVR